MTRIKYYICLGVLFLTSLLTIYRGTYAQPKKPQSIQNTPPELRLKGFEEHLQMKKTTPYASLKWQFLGPINVSGRCTGMAVVTPKGKNYTIYVATASGGVWKTDNEGTTWVPIFDQELSTSIGAIALSPTNPNLIWVGTGEANIFRSSHPGCGVYKSEDGGKTWKHMGLTDTNTIARIVINPVNPNIVYVAASGHEWTFNQERGVYKTEDGGKTWKKVLYINDQTGAIDLIMDPKDSQILYAATWQRIREKWNDPRNEPNYTGSGIWKTVDGGNTWKPINNGLPEPKFRGRIGLTICLSKPETLYALVDNYEIGRQPTEEEKKDVYGLPSTGIIKGATVYRSDDRGENWRLVAPTTEAMKKYLERHSGTYGWVFGQIKVDPNNSEVVYIMGVPMSVSRDGGKTFTEIESLYHVDNHGLWIDPENSNYLVNVNDGGLEISYDGGKNWRNTRMTLPVCQFFNVNYDMDTPFHVYGSMQDHGSFRAPVDLSRGRDNIRPIEFESAPGGEGSHHAIDPTNPNIVYSCGFYGNLTRTDLRLKGPERTKLIVPRVYPDEPRLRGQWLAHFILSPHNHNIVYLGMQYLFRSLDRGDTWERISPDLSYYRPEESGDIPYHTITAISESPLMYGLIYVGTDDGRVSVTRDGGKTWKEITAGLPYHKWVSRLVASQYDLGTVYLTQQGQADDDFAPYIWVSKDFGQTWVDIGKGIPLGPVNVIREDPVDQNILYVGTDIGVYVSKDQGKTWYVLGGNLPSTYVDDLIIHPRDNMIVIATHGRGMWVMDADPINDKPKKIKPWYEEED
ncbi:MAG: WD40/YVTN/BNR-like repeat-containing protein [Candidatus Saccharicenans sp.]